MRRGYISVDVDTSVDVRLDEIVDALGDDDLMDLIRRRCPDGLSVPVGLGDGDVAYSRNIVARAEAAARRLPNLPAEIRELFWHVHGVAIA